MLRLTRNTYPAEGLKINKEHRREKISIASLGTLADEIQWVGYGHSEHHMLFKGQ